MFRLCCLIQAAKPHLGSRPNPADLVGNSKIDFVAITGSGKSGYSPNPNWNAPP